METTASVAEISAERVEELRRQILEPGYSPNIEEGLLKNLEAISKKGDPDELEHFSVCLGGGSINIKDFI